MKTIRKLSIFYPTIPPLDNPPTILRRMSTLSMNKTFTYFVNYKDFYSVHQFLFDHHDLRKLKLFNAPVHISCLITLLRLCMSSRVRKTYTNLCVCTCPLDDDIHSRTLSKPQTVYRLQNSLYFCVFKYARADKQKVCNEADYRRVRLARFVRVRLLRHTLPISLLILRKKPTVLQSRLFTRSFTIVHKEIRP